MWSLPQAHELPQTREPKPAFQTCVHGIGELGLVALHHPLVQSGQGVFTFAMVLFYIWVEFMKRPLLQAVETHNS
jgi:hypothetical protein